VHILIKGGAGSISLIRNSLMTKGFLGIRELRVQVQKYRGAMSTPVIKKTIT